jgi:hypothetical protein
VELIEGISDSLSKHVSKAELESAPNQRYITRTYWYNCSTAPDVPGGRLGDGVRRVDCLLGHTMFGGMERNDNLVRPRRGDDMLPHTFELICEERYPPPDGLED